MLRKVDCLGAKLIMRSRLRYLLSILDNYGLLMVCDWVFLVFDGFLMLFRGFWDILGSVI